MKVRKTMKGESFKTWLFRQGLNWYPMYWCTQGQVLFLKHNWQHAIIRLRLGFWTKNYVGTIFGGSMFSALDPFHMVLLLKCLGKDYIVWDKAANIQFKRPGRGILTAEILYEDQELSSIRQELIKNGRHEFVKSTDWVDQQGQVIATLQKTIYVATKEHFKNRKKNI